MERIISNHLRLDLLKRKTKKRRMVITNCLRYRQHLIVLQILLCEIGTIIRILHRTNQTIDNHLTLCCRSIHICFDDIGNELLGHTINGFIGSIRRVLNQMHDIVERTSQLVVLNINREQSVFTNVCKINISISLLNQLDTFLSRIEFVYRSTSNFICFTSSTIDYQESTLEQGIEHEVTIHLIYMRQVLRINIDDIILGSIIMNEVIIFLHENITTEDFEILVERFIELDNITDGSEKMLNRKDVLINNLTDFFTSKCAKAICNIVVQNSITSEALCTDTILQCTSNRRTKNNRFTN